MKESTHACTYTDTSPQVQAQNKDKDRKSESKRKWYECKRTENNPNNQQRRLIKGKNCLNILNYDFHMKTMKLQHFHLSCVPLRKLFLICIHFGDGPNPGCEWQQSSAGWRLFLEVPVYASLGGPSSGTGLAGQRWATAWRTTQLLPAQRRYSPT